MEQKEVDKIQKEVDEIMQNISGYITEFSSLSAKEKDAVLAFMFVTLRDLSKSVLALAKNSNKTTARETAEIKEIEDILSLGPKWFHYTRKVKRNKK